MPFKFLKEMIGAIKEGIEEGKAELAEEKAAETLQAEHNAARLEEVSDEEKFIAALGAPYRRLFVSEEPYFLCSCAMPEGNKAEVGKFLNRDFDIVDADSLKTMILRAEASVVALLAIELVNRGEHAQLSRIAANSGLGQAPQDPEGATVELLETLEDVANNPESHNFANWADRREKLTAALFSEDVRPAENRRGLVALWTARTSYAATASAGLGLIEESEAVRLVAPLAQFATKWISSWSEYGELFLLGEKDDGTNSFLGRKAMRSMVAALNDAELGIWTRLAWPG